MYFYIFDPGKDKEIKYFERIQGRLLNHIAEAHIEGESYRVTSIRTVELLTQQALGLEAKTIVVVGNDNSLNRVVNTLVRKKADVIVGFIPLNEASSLGKILGTPADISESVKVLSSRLIYEFDLGTFGEHYFLSKVDLGNPFTQVSAGFLGLGGIRTLVNLPNFPIKLCLDDSFTVSTEVLATQIINCRSNEGCRFNLGDPTDSLLDVLILNKLSLTQILRYRKELASGCLDNVPGATIMHAKKISILGPRKLPLVIEGQTYTKAPATITVAEQKIKIIVGKNRQF